MALNVLRRAGKNEVADALEETAAASPSQDRVGCTAGKDEECTFRHCATQCPAIAASHSQPAAQEGLNAAGMSPFEAFVDLAGRMGWDAEQEYAGGLFKDRALQAIWDTFTRNPLVSQAGNAPAGTPVRMLTNREARHAWLSAARDDNDAHGRMIAIQRKFCEVNNIQLGGNAPAGTDAPTDAERLWRAENALRNIEEACNYSPPKQKHARTAEILRAQARALLASRNGEATDGWKLVPVEPTREMWDAVNKLDDEMAAGGYDGKGCSIEQAWDCLLAAAPDPSAQPEATK